MAKFLELLDQKGVTPEMFQERLISGVLADILDPVATFQNRDQWLAAFGLGAIIPEQIILTIDYTKSLKEMIAAGDHNWKKIDFTVAGFKIVGEGVVEYEFRCFYWSRNVSSQTAVSLIIEEDVENPWEPAKIEHLLAFGTAFPDEQFPIVALGTARRVIGRRVVPYLDGDDSERRLDLYWWDVVWDSRCRFLAVRKLYRD